MAGRHHGCNEHELGQTLRDGEGQRGLACCSPWGHKESNTTGQLNNDDGANLISYRVLSYNRCIMLFTQIRHKNKQTQKVKKVFVIL